MVTNFQSHYIPNTVAEQDDLLAAVGLSSVDDLFSDIPDDYRNPPLRLPDSDVGVGDPAGTGRDGRPQSSPVQWSVVPGRRQLLPLHSLHSESGHDTRRVFDRLHALPAGSVPGHPAGHLRVPDDDQRPLRHGSGQRRNVRRRHQPCRGGADGLSCHPPTAGGRQRHRRAGLSPGDRHLLPGAGHCHRYRANG